MYNINVGDKLQPMLVSRPKKKDQREGAPDMLYLLPELCTMTGLTDEMKSNFTLVKDLGVHTRVDPNKRAETLMTFRKQIDQNAEAKSRMTRWGVKYADNLVKLDARLLPPETIALGGQKKVCDIKVVMNNLIYHLVHRSFA